MRWIEEEGGYFVGLGMLVCQGDAAVCSRSQRSGLAAFFLHAKHTSHTKKLLGRYGTVPWVGCHLGRSPGEVTPYFEPPDGSFMHGPGRGCSSRLPGPWAGPAALDDALDPPSYPSRRGLMSTPHQAPATPSSSSPWSPGTSSPRWWLGPPSARGTSCTRSLMKPSTCT